MLADILGFDKYSEITSEYVIRGTYVDLAIKMDGSLQTLIEVKAIALDLKEAYVKQAVDYAANQGVEWIVLTNGVYWQVYKVLFNKPIEQDLVVEFDFLDLNPRENDDIEKLFLLTKEGWTKSLLGEYHAQRQALSRYFIGALLQCDSVLNVIRRELKRLSPNVRIDTSQIQEVLVQEVLKRDVVEGEKAVEAKKKIDHAGHKSLRKKSKSQNKEKLLKSPDVQKNSQLGNVEAL
jgi:predicted type IV restriction endonuclease